MDPQYRRQKGPWPTHPSASNCTASRSHLLHWKEKSTAAIEREASRKTDQDTQLYLQRRAELEDDGKESTYWQIMEKPLELEEYMTFETLAEVGSAHQICTDDQRPGILSLTLRHELVGEEFARELNIVRDSGLRSEEPQNM